MNEMLETMFYLYQRNVSKEHDNCGELVDGAYSWSYLIADGISLLYCYPLTAMVLFLYIRNFKLVTK